MVLIISGDEVIVKDVLEDSVLLPCNCSERNLDMDFKWQREYESSKMLVFKHNRKSSVFFDRYEGRAKIFLSENKDNCSVLLTNITEDDQGSYKCIFFIEATYQRPTVYLNFSARYYVCQTDDRSGKVFQCDVKGHHKKAEIQWRLRGQILTNSSTTGITHTHTLNASTGLYHFNSKLSTKLNWTSKPTCHVEAKGISTTIIIPECPDVEKLIHPQFRDRHQYFTIVPIMLLLGFLLVLWCHRADVSPR